MALNILSKILKCQYFVLLTCTKCKMALDFKKSPMDSDTICGIIEDITIILLYVISNTSIPQILQEKYQNI